MDDLPPHPKEQKDHAQLMRTDWLQGATAHFTTAAGKQLSRLAATCAAVALADNHDQAKRKSARAHDLLQTD